MKKTLEKFINPLPIILVAAAFRLIPHVPNFAPISAMALFGGVYLNKRWAILAPLFAMFVSNYFLLYINPFSTTFLNFTKIYSPFAIFNTALLPVYFSFIISGLIGIWLKNHKTVPNIIGASLLCSAQFFLITNAAVWAGGMYDRSILGLWESYIAGIPFFRGTFVGDIVFTMMFFGSYEFAKSFLLKKAKVKVA